MLPEILHRLADVLVPVAHAVDLTPTVNQVSGGFLAEWFCGSAFSCSPGTGYFRGWLAFIADKLLLLAAPVATFMIVKAGVTLMGSQEEDKLTTAKRQITASVIGVMLAFFAQKFVQAFYFPGGVLDPDAGVAVINAELRGIYNWGTVLIAVIAVFMVIVSGIKAMQSFGKEDGHEEVKRTLFWVVIGILLLLSTSAIRATLGLPTDIFAVGEPSSPTPDPVISRVLDIVSTVLTYLAAAAMAVIIYGAVRLIVLWGDEEQYKATKSLIVRVLAGLLVVLLSYAMAQFLMYLIS